MLSHNFHFTYAQINIFKSHNVAFDEDECEKEWKKRKKNVRGLDQTKNIACKIMLEDGVECLLCVV